MSKKPKQATLEQLVSSLRVMNPGRLESILTQYQNHTLDAWVAHDKKIAEITADFEDAVAIALHEAKRTESESQT